MLRVVAPSCSDVVIAALPQSNGTLLLAIMHGTDATLGLSKSASVKVVSDVIVSGRSVVVCCGSDSALRLSSSYSEASVVVSLSFPIDAGSGVTFSARITYSVDTVDDSSHTVVAASGDGWDVVEFDTRNVVFSYHDMSVEYVLFSCSVDVTRLWGGTTSLSLLFVFAWSASSIVLISESDSVNISGVTVSMAAIAVLSFTVTLVDPT